MSTPYNQHIVKCQHDKMMPLTNIMSTSYSDTIKRHHNVNITQRHH